jgi:hypothetical protein
MSNFPNNLWEMSVTSPCKKNDLGSTLILCSQLKTRLKLRINRIINNVLLAKLVKVNFNRKIL